MKIIKVNLLIIILISVFSCKKNPHCKDVFAEYGLIIQGDTLYDFYSVLDSNTYIDIDTIRFDVEEPFTGWLPVLDDTYYDLIKENKFPTNLTFIGLDKDQNIIVSESYLFIADECNVFKLQGADKVEL